MKTIFADLHIHIGRTESGRPVKITGSKSLTIDRILYEASEEKGIDMIGVIDCHVPEILQTLEKRVQQGTCTEHPGGGVVFNQTSLLLGSEIEIYDEKCQGPLHVLAFLPTIDKMWLFSEWLSTRMKNRTLSSQRIYETGANLQEKVKELGGLFIPAHIFTPFKSLYGSGVQHSLSEVFNPNLIDAVELGLSSDTSMADQISELHSYPFVTNSDAHSLAKIGREYQKLSVKEASFDEFTLALKQQHGRGIVANYGLNPRLGKYHVTACEKCLSKKINNETKCLQCDHHRFTKGVSNRLLELKDTNINLPTRPPYIHQVPLEYLPGLGPKTLERLKNHFGTEMKILHEVQSAMLEEVVPRKIVDMIIAARHGTLNLKEGGGGVYGKVLG
ncbi:hypothetical protein AJ85_17965 [Alkalihalobacillus alcalophilus ATCC 27647 = CGMCC 1.3604]|uniref:TIGR00375 family protein n=1 Tax=Alkalihalobacillus alcalophilus ATCC 27647 = CGMCC 1.3604 TaxID=1218173 RepID=A0A094WL71_ALKAL|nr:endonuclease Q family protein [Alkalihalobacillus alcalophilus]KGA96683.1 hypothetical protein BALCAV_0214725 [Alkalihalobacillus alcalophilus ATCC 27647 = CGMCC 1.3604]MED1562386.1 endonuclease Q family protein [Alkalihalobacillus alcalophilus]THG89394.1 hypothetical protein AJ85_17965 [Alkalihalobacillus alcalophilus ATCC 27647 = CGMCC 1.3604]